MELSFRDTRIYYSAKGTGNPVVLLHGFLESSRIWEPFIPEFSKYGQVIAIDLPGHGRSGCFGEIHKMEDMAEAVYAVMQELNIQKADFIGHSMGGYVALAFLEQHPEMAGEFMLLNSTPEEDSEEKKENRERAIEVVRKNKKAFISMAISNLLTPKNEKKYVNEINILKQRAYDFPTSGITAALKGMKIRTNKISVLKNFDGTKVIVTGKKDPLIELNSIKSIAEESNCRFYALPGGHLSYLESSDQFLKLCISSKK